MFNHSVRRPFIFAATALFAGITVCGAESASAQVATDSPAYADATNDLHLHKFVPRVSPEMAALTASATDQVTDASGISRFAAKQIQALQDEKDSRTAAQRKIDSNVLYTERMLLGQDAAPGVSYLETGLDIDTKNNLAVDIVANVTEGLLAQLAAAGASVLQTNIPLRSIRAIIAPEKIEGIAASPDVIFISPLQQSFTNRIVALPKTVAADPWNLSPSFAVRADRVKKMLAGVQAAHPNTSTGTQNYGQGSVETEGDVTHQAAQARGTYAVTGAGLKIGVLSNGVTTVATSIATGDLPPMCGSGVPSPCLTVLAGSTGDEGTAMLEIIHDMVPGADLYFATGNGSITTFASNIRALRTAGCSVIVDDLGYFIEFPFQDGQSASIVSNTNGGVVTQAVNDVVATGAFYFSSAANSGSVDNATSGTYEGDFVPLPATAPLVTSGNVHNFGSGVGYDAITLTATTATLFWSDPLGASSNDYDLYALNSAGTAVVLSSTNIQSGTQDAAEIVQSSTALAANVRLVVYQKSGAANRFFHLNLSRGTLAVNTSGETHGHSSATGAYSVAATPALTPYSSGTPTGPFPGPFVTSDKTETFSSDGFRRIFFNADSTPITPGNFSSTGGTVLNKPDITASDGVSVTGVGGFGSPFYGTSAAAPSAASIAALLLAAKPTITAAQMKTALTSTAIDIMATGFDRDAGSGIVMALPAMQSIGATGGANLEFGVITADENPGDGNGAIEAGEGGVLTIQLKNTTGVQAATGITATLTSTTAGVVIKQPATISFPNLAAGAGPVTGASTFGFTLPTTLGCATSVQFTLTIAYSGSQSRVLTFTLPVGLISVTNTLGSTPTTPAGITFGTGTQSGRVSRSAVVSACGTAKVYPGTIAGNHTYDSYTFQSCSTSCFSPVVNAGSAGINLFTSMYAPFAPPSISANYSGDAGSSSATETFGVNITAGTSYSVVVAEVAGNPPSTAIPNTYTVQIPSCALKCSPYPLPIAIAQNVTVTASTPSGTAAANINNGSNDPNGGAITLTQFPVGPYPIGVTNVTLTITNKFGAFAQASANVTVNPITQTITFPAFASAGVFGFSGPYTLAATATSGLPITYTVSGPATVNGSTLTFTGPGTVVVTANQAGGSGYAAATPVSQSLFSIASVPTSALAPGASTGTLTVTFTASSAFTIGSVTLASSDGTSFQMVSGGTCTAGLALAAGGTCTVKYTYAALSPGLTSAKITINDNAATPAVAGTLYVAALRYR